MKERRDVLLHLRVYLTTTVRNTSNTLNGVRLHVVEKLSRIHLEGGFTKVFEAGRDTIMRRRVGIVRRLHAEDHQAEAGALFEASGLLKEHC